MEIEIAESRFDIENIIASWDYVKFQKLFLKLYQNNSKDTNDELF